MMNCEQAKPLLNAYVDGELEAAAILELEHHVSGCPGCAKELRNLQSLRKNLKQDALYFAAPAELLQRIKAELPAPIETVSRPAVSSWNWFTGKWLSTALTGMATVCLALILIVMLARNSPTQPLAQEIVSSHIRSLMASHALDVVSTDQHTVKPWFNGKLDFAPPVQDLAAQDFPLIGGRLDYLAGRSVAALVFKRHQHIINLFIWPTSEPEAKPAALPPQQGFHLVHWTLSGMIFWAVSDLNEKELAEFAQAYGQSTPVKNGSTAETPGR